jgi:outer membrane protein OmpA-like peptidoglycan-associated protein
MLQLKRGGVVRSLAMFALTMGLLDCGGSNAPAEPPREQNSETGSEPGVTPTSAPSLPSNDAPDTQAGAADVTETPAAAPASSSFVLRTSNTVKDAHGTTPSAIKATATEAAMKFVVVDKDKGPISGIVISLTDPAGKKFYTAETDASGYAEVLVPIGQKYELVYLSLGREDVAASVTVTNEPHQNIRLTMRYKRFNEESAPRFVLDGVTFDTAKATIKNESYPRLDKVVEYLLHKNNTRIQISGHTDNVGNPKTNKSLSLKRAQACRDYLISKGIDAGRIEAVGYGDERPIATNDTDEGRQQNRRIEAIQL